MQLADRAAHLQGVQRDGGDRADRRQPCGHQVRAPQQGRHDRQHEGHVDAGEQHRAQPQGARLGGERLALVRVDPVPPAPAQAERVDRAGALDRLADRAVERRVRGRLAQVARRGPAQVPARGQQQRRHAHEQRQRDAPVHGDGGDDGEQHGRRRDQDPRHAEPHGVLHPVDVVGGPAQQVTGAGPLDHRQRQPGHRGDELLAQLGEHRLAEHQGRALGVADRARSGRARRSTRTPTARSTNAPVGPRRRRVDDPAEQPRPREAGERREGVQAQDQTQGAPVAPQQPQGVLAQGGRVSDGQLHGAPPPGGRRPVDGGRRRRRRRARPRAVARAAPTSVSRRAARGGCPRPRTRPSSTRTTSSTRSSTSGLAVTTTVVRPARALASRAAMRASVWASTALVGSTSTSTSASVSSARARASRCRWPPDSERPFSVTSPSRPLRHGVEHVVRVGDVAAPRAGRVVAAGRARRARRAGCR